MVPMGFEWIVIVSVLLSVVLPVAVVVAVIVFVVHRVRKGGQASQSDSGGTTVEAANQGDPRRREGATTPRSGIDSEAKARIDTFLGTHNLTDRERDILLSVYAGKTQAQIADELFLSRSTVGTYCTRAYEKLGVETKEEAVATLDGVASGQV